MDRAHNFTAAGRETTVTDPGTYTLSIIQATCIFTKDIVITMNGCVNPVKSFVNIDNQGWEQTSWVAASAGQTFELSPTPTSGNWSWTGPNGFTNSNRAITVSSLGTYTATYTEGNCTFNQEVTFTECGPNPITESYNANNQGWTNGNTNIHLPSGEVYIKPYLSNPVNFPDFPPTWWNQPDKWLWTGPNGFSAIGFSLRVPYDKPGIYTAAMTYGPCTWTMDFTIFNCLQDTDNDGVCDPVDICPGGDDNLDANMDGTPDDCEICSDIILNINSPNISYDISANQNITTNGTIISGSSVQIHAGNYVELSAALEVFIAPCE